MDGPFVYRFTNDLRLDDHAGLAAAASHGNVLPLLIVDPGLHQRLAHSPRRAAFFCSAVAALDEELRERGSRLVVRRGPLDRILIELSRGVGASGVAWSASYGDEPIGDERRLQAALEEAGLAALAVHDAPAVPPEETSASRSIAGLGYRAFAPYFDVWQERPVVSHEFPLLVRFDAAGLESEPLPRAQEFGATAAPPEASARAARAIFERFLRNDATQYASAAIVPAQDRTSHLAAHLSFGTISARAIVRGVRDRLSDPLALSEERLSLKRYLRAIARRDFFLQLAWYHPDAQERPLQDRLADFPWSRTHTALEAWKTGTTGFPLVDAGIRQLHATGWMHPLVRAVAASFLCFDLNVDWRVGRAEWEKWLIEDDPALSAGNWQWVAGVGADMAQYPRIYNPERQRRRCDPDGLYVRRWIEELRHTPMTAWQHAETNASQLALALFESAYPTPVLDHAPAARAFLARYRAFVSL